MNPLPKLIVMSTLLGITSVSFNAHADTVYDNLKIQMMEACPAVWEDVGTAISASIPSGDLWAENAGDRAQFVELYRINNQVTLEEAESISEVLEAVASECAAYRLALVSHLVENTPNDIENALTAEAVSSPGTVETSAWKVGDVRITGRQTSDNGWIFLAGQTIGSTTSSAQLRGLEYRNLFELAKQWAPNSGNEDWSNNAVVALPDMRGRTLYGMNDMGGAVGSAMSAPQAGVLGAGIGTESVQLSVNQMPSHTHSMQNGGGHGHSMSSAGNHQHSMNTAGNHEHKLRTGVHTGSGAGRTDWKYFEGRARPNYQNVIAKGSGAVVADGNHVHSINAAGNHAHSVNAAGPHKHVNNATGGSAPVNTVSPGIVFNVEMKY